MCKEMCKSGGSMCGPTHKKIKAWGLLALRIALGLVFIYAGYGKLGPGREMGAAMMANFFPGSGMFWIMLVGLLEFVGGFMILLGAYAGYAATWLAVIMIVAMLTAHRTGPFTGFFVPLLALGGLLSLMGTGAGCYRLIKKQCCCKECKTTEEPVAGGCGGACGGNCNCGNK